MEKRTWVYAGLISLAVALALLGVFAFLEPEEEGNDLGILPAPGEAVDPDAVPTELEQDDGIVKMPVGTLKVGTKDTLISGVVLDEEGLPLEGMTVLLCSWEGEQGLSSLNGPGGFGGPFGMRGRRRGPPFGPGGEDQLEALGRRVKTILNSADSLTTGRNGRFAFEGVDPGLRRVAAFGARFLPGLSEGLQVVKGTEVETEVVLSAGEKISGRVVDNNGFPVSGASVRARWSRRANLEGGMDSAPSDQDSIRTALGAFPEDAVTGKNGDFEFPAVSPGFYELFAVKKDYARSDTATVEAGQGEVELVLSRGLSFLGVVRGLEEEGSKKPLVGAQVDAVFQGNRNAIRSSMRSLLFAESFVSKWGTETGQEGHFELTGLREGSYSLVVRREDYQPGIFLGVSVNPEQTEPVEFVLEPGSVLYGKVLGEGGKPEAGAQVNLLTRFRMEEPNWPRFQATTDKKGRFGFTSLSPARYSLYVEKEGYCPLTDSVEPKEEPVVLNLVPGGALGGHVVHGETPVPGARVSLRMEDRDRRNRRMRFMRFLMGGRGNRRRDTTDAKGHFNLTGLSQGTGRLEVEAEAYISYEQEVEIAAAKTQYVKVELQRSGVVKGKVSGEDGRPIAGAVVRLEEVRGEEDRGGGGRRRRRGPRRRPLGTPARTGENGLFVLSLPSPAEQVQAAASHPRYLGARSESFPVDDPGSDGPYLQLVLSEGAVLYGEVTGPSGDALSAVRVQVRRSRERDGRRRRGPGRFGRRGTTKSDISGKDGDWRISALQGGTYTVWVDHEGFAPFRGEVELGENEQRGFDIKLEEQAFLKGVVVTTMEEPIPSASVFARGSGVFRQVFSDIEGRFSLGGLSADQEYSLRIRASGFLRLREENVLAPHEGLVCELVEPAELSGYVLTAESLEPVSPFQLTLMPEGESEQRVPRPRDFDAPDGSFVIREIPPGSYRVRVHSTEFPPSEAEGIRLAEGEALTGMEILLDEGLVLRGKATAPSGKPLEGAEVAAIRIVKEKKEDSSSGEDSGSGSSEDERRRGRRRDRRGRRGRDREEYLRLGADETGQEGEFVLKGLEPGEYVVQASHDDWVPAQSKKLKVTGEGGAPFVELKLKKGQSIEGKVVLGDGSPAENIFVRLTGTKKQLNARTGENGSFKFRGLEAGAYKVQAFASRSERSKPVNVTVTKKDIKDLTVDKWLTDSR